MHILVTAPPVTGQIIPIAKIATGIKRPILWLRSRQNAIALATAWTRNDENSAHRNTWYHISERHNKPIN